MTELRAVEVNRAIELLAEFKGLILGLSIAGGFTALRILIEKLTGV